MNAPAVISDIVICTMYTCCTAVSIHIQPFVLSTWSTGLDLLPPLSCSYWLDGVLPMVLDREVGAQEKCLQLLEELLLANITTINKWGRLINEDISYCTEGIPYH